MRTIDRTTVRAHLERVFAVASDVERWPEFLRHYRWVRLLERDGDHVLVEMAAWRSFGPLKVPTWWVSEMRVSSHGWTVRYRHVRGITRGMEVEWRLEPHQDGVAVTIEHLWEGPSWPLVGRFAAERVIGPVFIHHIAGRTLAGIKRRAEGP
jgi:ribosome-associated toxin RatA of RatAB toxin-antitoxin module